MTVNEIVEELKKSQGFVIYVGFIRRDEQDQAVLEHRYARQQLPSEDLEKSFEEFSKFVGNDLRESGANLLTSAEAIAKKVFPAEESQQ